MKRLNKDKMRSKKEIKAWVSGFEKEHGRGPGIADKEVVRHMFEAHLEVCVCVRASVCVRMCVSV